MERGGTRLSDGDSISLDAAARLGGTSQRPPEDLLRPWCRPELAAAASHDLALAD